MTPILLPFQPLSRHVKTILMPSCLLSRCYEADFVAILPFLLLYELDFAVIRLPIRPYLTFHPVRFLPVFGRPSYMKPMELPFRRLFYRMEPIILPFSLFFCIRIKLCCYFSARLSLSGFSCVPLSGHRLTSGILSFHYPLYLLLHPAYHLFPALCLFWSNR